MRLYVAVLGTIVGLLFGYAIFAMSTGRDSYTDRIEAKYDIDVIDIAGKYADGTVTYIDSDGRTCAAAQAPGDELVFLSCQEVGS